jgi:hypothetical protein
MFENLDQLRGIRKKALVLTSIGKWRIVNAEKPAQEVEENLIAALRS